jgi:phosphoglycolate phosphatase/pyrophosphatase PpaX
MKFARILSLLLALLMVACAFVACDQEEPTEDPDAAAETVSIQVVEQGYTNYVIIRDYKANGLADPDIIYGWDIPKGMRKPAPGTLFDLMEKFNLKPEEILVVDDLKPGYDMAKAAGVDIAAAGWAHNVKGIRDFMMANCEYFCESVEELRQILFS